MVKTMMTQTSILLQRKTNSHLLKHQPSLAIQLLEIQPSLAIQLLEIQPSLAIQLLEIQPSLAIQLLEIQPSLATQPLEIIPPWPPSKWKISLLSLSVGISAFSDNPAAENSAVW